MNSEAQTLAVMLQMYNALDNLPCGCCRRWDKESADGFTVTKVCGRCKALRAYEAIAAAPMGGVAAVAGDTE